MKELSAEEKELLVKDLCAKAPYGVKVQYDNKIYNIDYISPLYEEVKLDIPDNYTVEVFEIKPYLRPLSSMTDEEHKEYEQWLPDGYCIDTIDWLNKNHFDYRGLIPMDLALEAPKDMYS